MRHGPESPERREQDDHHGQEYGPPGAEYQPQAARHHREGDRNQDPHVPQHEPVDANLDVGAARNVKADLGAAFLIQNLADPLVHPRIDELLVGHLAEGDVDRGGPAVLRDQDLAVERIGELEAETLLADLEVVEQGGLRRLVHELAAADLALRELIRLDRQELVYDRLLRDGALELVVDDEHAVDVALVAPAVDQDRELLLRQKKPAEVVLQQELVEVKDLNLAAAIAQEVDAPIPLGGLVKQMLAATIANGKKDWDLCALVTTYELMANLEIKPAKD